MIYFYGALFCIPINRALNTETQQNSKESQKSLKRVSKKPHRDVSININRDLHTLYLYGALLYISINRALNTETQ